MNTTGMLTSMGKNKRYNRKNEILYTQLETLASMLKEKGVEYPEEVIERGWEILLLNQFHDIIPGSCIEEVYVQTDKEYEEILSRGKETLHQISIGAIFICTDDHAIIVYNTQGYVRNDIIVVEGLEKIAVAQITDAKGNMLPMQKTLKGKLYFMQKAFRSMDIKYSIMKKEMKKRTTRNGMVILKTGSIVSYLMRRWRSFLS